MAKRSKAPARPNSVQDMDSLTHAIARKGELDRQRASICSEAEDQINVIAQGVKLTLITIDAEIKQIEADVQSYAEANKTTLLPEGRKSVDLVVGDLGWRTVPASVTVPGGDEVAVPKLEAAGLNEFVRTLKVVNKEAILALYAERKRTKISDENYNKVVAHFDDLTDCAAVRIVKDKENFWFTPKTVAMPEHAGAPDDAALEAVAA